MNTRRDRRELAEALTKRSMCRVKMAAVITDAEGRVVSWGWNHAGRDALGEHAEEMALKRANTRRLEGATLTVAGFRKASYVKSLPCLVRCMPRIVKARIARVEYHTKEGTWEVME